MTTEKIMKIDEALREALERLEKLLRQMRDMRSGQARTEAGDEIYDMFIRLYATKATPSREEAPTDEQVERFVAVYEKACQHRYDRDAIRAALKAAGPSAQQRVSEEMVERARKNLAASGIWVSAHGVMQVLEAALSPENGGA